jgi:hypothetical protein
VRRNPVMAVEVSRNCSVVQWDIDAWGTARRVLMIFDGWMAHLRERHPTRSVLRRGVR